MNISHPYVSALMLLLIFSQCGKKHEEVAEVLRPVSYIEANNSSYNKTRTFRGIAKAGNELELSFRSSGIILSANTVKGHAVKKGEVIAKLDNLEAKLAYEKSISSLNSAESDFYTQTTELDRVKSLYEKGSASLKEYQVAKNSFQNAKAQFESAKRNKVLQQSQIEYGVIYAPSDGVIANTFGKVNERVQSGHVFAILNAGKKIKISMEVPETVINEIEVGMKASIKFSALKDLEFNGVVAEVSPSTTSSVTFPVEIELQNAISDIKPGMAASVTLDLSNDRTKTSMIYVPVRAVGEDGSGNFVFVLETVANNVGIAKKTRVTIGELTNDGFEIRSGLKNGQLVAVAGLQSLLDGQKVKLK